MPIYAAIFKGGIKIVNTFFTVGALSLNASDNTVVNIAMSGTQYDDAVRYILSVTIDISRL